MVAGRDLVSGGTWFGVRNDRWAAVTNVREGTPRRQSTRSRGWLVRDYLCGLAPPQAFLAEINSSKMDYAGFNLLLGDGEELWYGSNRGPQAKLLESGFYGLSNHLLDTPWPKVLRGKRALRALFESGRDIKNESAFAALADTTRAADHELPQTGIPLSWEQALSASFVVMPQYGTRSAALLQRSASGTTRLVERRFAGTPEVWDEDTFQWAVNGSLLDR